MENFFVNDRFYTDLEEYIDELVSDFLFDINSFEDFTLKIELTNLEPCVQLRYIDFEGISENIIERNIERFPDDFNDQIIVDALKYAFDLEKLNEKMPKLYYPANEYEYIEINKQMLINYAN